MRGELRAGSGWGSIGMLRRPRRPTCREETPTAMRQQPQRLLGTAPFLGAAGPMVVADTDELGPA